jgi:YD repeat-containing protein
MIQPWQLNDGNAQLPRFKVRLQPGGSTWYQNTGYNTANQPTSQDTHSSSGSESISYGYVQTQYTNETFSEVVWTGSRLQTVTSPDVTWLANFAWTQWVDTRNVLGDDGSYYTFTYSYPYAPQLEATGTAGDGFTYFNTRGQVTGSKLPTGLTITNLFGTNGFLSRSIALETHSTNTYTFTKGLLSSRTDPLGLNTTYTWDNLERLTSVRFPDSTTISNQYTWLDLTGQKDRLNHWTSASYDHMRRPYLLTDRNGNTSLLNYCPCGSLDSIIDPLGNYTLFYRDLQGHPTNIVFGTQGSQTLTYDLSGQLTGLNDSSGLNLTFAHDNLGRLIQVSSSAGQVFGAAYAMGNHPSIITNSDGVATDLAYIDDYNRLTGRYVSGTTEMSQGWHYDNSRGVVDSSANYFANGGAIWTYYGYDPAGRLVSSTNALGNVVQLGYGRAGELLSLTNENNAATSWRYDLYGRMVAKTNANGLCVETNGYDANGQLTARWTPAKGLTHYSYDNNGNLLGIAYSSGPGVSASYDALNRLTRMSDVVGKSSFTWQNFGAFRSAPASETSPWGETVSHAYQDRQLQSVALGGWSQSYGYDGQRRLQTITSPAGSFTYHYAGAGSQVQSLSLPGGSSIGYAYDPAGLLTYTGLTNSLHQVLDAYTYGYDDLGLRQTAARLDNSAVQHKSWVNFEFSTNSLD